jgi:hypothetical protein
MLKRTVLGFAAIAASTSCVPPSTRVAGPLADVPVRDAAEARNLLAGLALEAPAEPLDRAFAGSAASTDDTPRTLAAAPAFPGAAQSDDDRQRAIACLTAAVYYEARSEPTDGQRAVAQVVLNRVRDRAFPHSVCGVVYQGSTRRTGCQFSFTCDGSMNHPRDGAAWARAASVARAAFDGSVFAPVGAKPQPGRRGRRPYLLSLARRDGARAELPPDLCGRRTDARCCARYDPRRVPVRLHRTRYGGIRRHRPSRPDHAGGGDCAVDTI